MTSISGNADILIQNSSMLDEEKNQAVYTNINDAAIWLVNLVENMLAVTRIENGTMAIHMEPELMDEIFHEALHHLDRNISEHQLSVELSDDLLMAQMDARLIVQVLINLINNAVKYTPAGSHIQLKAEKPDVILLDLGLPDTDGVEIIKKVRGWSNTPIIVVSARSEDRDKVEALDAGADDYLTKPFSVDELLARLRVALRRVSFDGEKTSQESSQYENGELKIDYAAGCVYREGREIHLTPIEYRLLRLLARNTGKVLTYNYILKEFWGKALPSDTPPLRVFMATLRKKIEPVPSEPRYIQPHIGIGYRMLHVSENS